MARKLLAVLAIALVCLAHAEAGPHDKLPRDMLMNHGHALRDGGVVNSRPDVAIPATMPRKLSEDDDTALGKYCEKETPSCGFCPMLPQGSPCWQEDGSCSNCFVYA